MGYPVGQSVTLIVNLILQCLDCGFLDISKLEATGNWREEMMTVENVPCQEGKARTFYFFMCG